ncbi:MAG: hypothetical protein HQK88_08635 [Nitrospirae bacterium]|nr:hypothetical protein [Nitrospirota bacterium]MBF0535347.1 hypothetical protein [Nitrospirota bacterium]MBF0616868.1 hypothetical protein [Nitrospirota bacterium]
MENKYSMKIVALVVLMMFGFCGNLWATAYYYLPYFHTNAGNVIYCVASNTTNGTVTPTITVTAASNASPTSNTYTLSDIAAKTSQMITFSGTSVLEGTSVTSILGAFSGSVTDTISYGGTLAFIGSGDCSTIIMSCFQGNTTPKRNVTGYNCYDGTNHFAY